MTKMRGEPFALEDFDPADPKWPQLRLKKGRGLKPWVRSVLDVERRLRVKDVVAILGYQNFEVLPDRVSTAFTGWKKANGYTSFPPMAVVNTTPGGLPANWLPPELEDLREVLEGGAEVQDSKAEVPNLAKSESVSAWTAQCVRQFPSWTVKDFSRELQRQGGNAEKSKTTWGNEVLRWRKSVGLSPLPQTGGIALPAGWTPPSGDDADTPTSWPTTSLWVKHMLAKNPGIPMSWFEQVLIRNGMIGRKYRRSLERVFDSQESVAVRSEPVADDPPDASIGGYFEMLYEGWPAGKNYESVPMTATQIFGLLKSQKNPLLGLLPTIDGKGRAYPVALLMLSSIPKLHPRTWGYRVEIGRSDKGVKVYTLVKEGEVVKPVKSTESTPSVAKVAKPTSPRTLEVTGPWSKPASCNTSEAIKKLEHVHELLGPICKAMGWRGLEYDVATGKVSAFKERAVKPQLPDWLEVDE